MRDYIYPPVIVAAKTAFKALGLRFRIRGTENIPRSGGAVLACNHISYVDFVFAGLAADSVKRRVRFMAKQELFRHRITGPLMRGMRHIEVDRADGLASYREAVRYLEQGELVGVFPEATISYSFEPKEFKTGAVRLASEADVPLVPVIVWGTHRMFPKGRDRDFSRGQTLAISVGAPLRPTGADAVAETVALKAAMVKLLDETVRTYPEMPAGAWWLPASYGGGAPTPEVAAEIYAEEMAERAARRKKS